MHLIPTPTPPPNILQNYCFLFHVGMAVGNAKVAIPLPPRMWYQSNTALEKSLQLAQICPENGDIG